MIIKELIIDPDDMETGIYATSIVDRPAMESHFVTLTQKQKQMVTMATANAEKRILMGAAMIPNKPILRLDEESGQEYYVYFSPSTVEACALSFARYNRQNSATVQHEYTIEGCTVFESWIKEDMEKDKSALHGITTPVKTWMMSMKVEDEAVWEEQIKTGKLRGFSIEGYFLENANISLHQQPPKSAETDLKSMISGIRMEISRAILDNGKKG